MLRSSLLTIAAICICVTCAHAMEGVKIVVIPFDIQAPKELSYLGSEIPEVVRKHLEQQGVESLAADAVPDVLLKKDLGNVDNMREIGVKTGADYVIGGSLTWVGQAFSLSAIVTDSSGQSPPDTFAETGEGIENLTGAVGSLSRSISAELLKLEKVAKVVVIGTQRVDPDSVKRVIGTQPGDTYLAKNLPKDIEAVHEMGYFDDVRAETESTEEGKIITFMVKEKSTVRQVVLEGNRIFEDEKITENLDVKPGFILNIFDIQDDADEIERMYKEKNYHNVKVDYSIRQLKNNQADLVFIVEEGPKLFVQKIAFVGNRDYSSRKLQSLMKTSEKGAFSWITTSGDLDTERLAEDRTSIASHYQNTGYVSASVEEPEVEFSDDGIRITMRINEGPRYRVGKVDITGDLLDARDELMELVQVSEAEYYNEEAMRNDVIALTDLYADKGYAYAEIFPVTDKSDDKGTVDVTYTVTKGKQVRFEKINIAGNTRTNDNVIRRELLVEEQGVYSGKELKRSIRNLYRLGLFEPGIQAETSRGSTDDTMVLDLVVRERSTREFFLGGMYSDYEGGILEGTFVERNFLGRGADLRVGLSIGGLSDTYYLSYIEPWLFDTPLAAGIEVYRQDIDYYVYDVSTSGSRLRFGYPIQDLTRLYFAYQYEVSEVTYLPQFSFFVPGSVGEPGVKRTASVVTTAIRYDSRDRPFDTTEGGDYQLSFEYAGLGGDIGFAKTVLQLGYYVPLHRRLTGFLHGEGGHIGEVSGKEIPDYERFYLGGVYSMRGFDYQAIAARRETDFGSIRVGGSKYVMLNLELLFTMSEESGLVMVLFYDTGNVFDDDEAIDFGRLRQSAGFGFRFYSPMGPIRIENGFILDPELGEESGGTWIFTIGSAFP